jgi:pimeloyl-ACP methyl ester carboxylesterase
VEPLVEHWLTLGGVETRALELEGRGPPLLLLHGWADSADTWRLALDRIARRGRGALAVDLPGFGDASPLAPGPMLPQLDDFARAALDYLAPGGGAVVCGNSLGGCVTLRLAERAELGLRGIVPVAPAGLDMARWFTLVERDVVLRVLLAAPVPVPGFAVRRAVGEVYRRLAFAHPGEVDARVVSTFARHLGDRDSVARRLALGRRLLPELRWPFRPERIACPVLLVWGARDLMVFQTGAQRILDAADEARLEVIEDCGHCPQIEATERLCDLLLDFPSPDAAGKRATARAVRARA